jgi:hypothetical protein
MSLSQVVAPSRAVDPDLDRSTRSDLRVTTLCSGS